MYQYNLGIGLPLRGLAELTSDDVVVVRWRSPAVVARPALVQPVHLVDDVIADGQPDVALGGEVPEDRRLCHTDLVGEMLRIAGGGRLPHTQEQVKVRGHAIEVRINAEKLPDFAPSPGRIWDKAARTVL